MRTRDTRLLVVLATSLICARALSIRAQSDAPKFKLTGFSVKGSERYSESAVLAASGLKLGVVVSADDLQSAMQRLTDTGAFASLQYQADEVGSTVSVTFKAVDSKQFVACRFANFVWLPEQQVLTELGSRVPLFTGQVSVGGHMADAIGAALESMLRERGITAKVDHTPFFEHGASEPSALVFKIHGPSLPIHVIDFTGASSLDPAALTRAVQPLIGRDYDRLAVEDIVNRLISALYQQRGYLRASFGMPQAELMSVENAAGPVRVSVPVNEGLAYKLGSVQWAGNKGIPAGDLSACIKLEPGKPADQSRLQEGVNQAASLYGSRGYVSAHISTEAAFDDAAQTVTFTLTVNEGDQYHMGQLQVNGIDQLHVAKVLHDARLHPGDPYDAAYWGTFLTQVVRDLPHNATGWNAQFNPVINQDSKTVDVTVNFTPGTAQ